MHRQIYFLLLPFPLLSAVVPLLLEVGGGKENASGSVVHQQFLTHCATSPAAVLAAAIVSEPKIEHLERELQYMVQCI